MVNLFPKYSQYGYKTLLPGTGSLNQHTFQHPTHLANAYPPKAVIPIQKKLGIDRNR